MCECGCTSNDERYLFPAPGNEVYMLTISGGCTDCDAGPGITIERFDKSNYWWEHREYLEGKLKFEKWSDTKGVAIITGHRKREFVKAILPHLVGADVSDEIACEVAIEEAYAASMVRPHFPTNADAA
jgi:hypothetical protein